MKKRLTLLLPVLIVSCTSSVQKENDLEPIEDIVLEQVENYKVEYVGALRDIMHKNDLTAKADLKDFERKEHFYGLGPVEGLKGEIIVYDSKPFIASVNGGDLSIDNSFDHKAAMFVYSSVDDWNSYEIPENVNSYEELERFVGGTAEKNGIDVNEPFPFLIKGVADSLSWHVIDWIEGDTVHTHEKHVKSGLHGDLDNVDSEILGFYSDKHHTIFTHHSTNMHLHFKNADENLAGHVDAIVLGDEMELMLPVINETSQNK